MDQEFRSADERRVAVALTQETGIDEALIETLIRAFYARVWLPRGRVVRIVQRKATSLPAITLAGGSFWRGVCGGRRAVVRVSDARPHDRLGRSHGVEVVAAVARRDPDLDAALGA